MRKLLIIAILVATAVVLYQTRLKDDSRAVLTQMIGVINDMDLPQEAKDTITPIVRSLHPGAFQESFDLTRKVGRKFNEASYQAAVMQGLIAELQAAGQQALADRVKLQAPFHNITVTEY